MRPSNANSPPEIKSLSIAPAPSTLSLSRAVRLLLRSLRISLCRRRLSRSSLSLISLCPRLSFSDMSSASSHHAGQSGSTLPQKLLDLPAVLDRFPRAFEPKTPSGRNGPACPDGVVVLATTWNRPLAHRPQRPGPRWRDGHPPAGMPHPQV